MSNKLPPKWRKYPKKGELINFSNIENIFIYLFEKMAVGLHARFIPFKTPLDEKFKNLNSDDLFTPQMIIKSQEDANQKIGLWIDLTNTDRYYDKRIVENAGIEYFKLSCNGNGNAPTPKQVQRFIFICKNFLLKETLNVICVHCTHGFNRTGFLICSYLVEELNWPLDKAIEIFISSRQPGIYKQEYLTELYKRYSFGEEPCKAPQLSWCPENDNSKNRFNYNPYKKSKRKNSKTKFKSEISSIRHSDSLEKNKSC